MLPLCPALAARRSRLAPAVTALLVAPLLMAPLLVAPLLPNALAAPAAAAAPATGAPVAAQATPAAPRALGFDRIGVRRSDTWYLRDALDGGANRSYREGTGGWQPVAGDFDGDGNGTVSLFRDGVWLLRDSEGGAARTVRYGQKGDQPVVGDWDGDGTDTIGLFRSGRWFLRSSNGAGAVSRQFGFGQARDVAVVGDWNGNGTDDIAVRRGITWFQRDAASGGLSSRRFDFGNAGDIPIAGDWDHDGRDTPGLFRAGTWFFRQGSFPSPYQTTRFGLRGDRPVVRRTQGLAPGVQHDVVRDAGAPWVAHVATVDLAAASSPETVLAGDRLQGTELTSSMTRRSGAVLGVNGDFFLGSGRPVHLFANDGHLAQTPAQLGRAFSLDRTGTQFSMGYPDVRTTVTASRPDTGTASIGVPRTNQGAPDGGPFSAFNRFGALLETPPDNRCYAALLPAGGRTVNAAGAVVAPFRSGTPRCGGSRPVVPGAGSILSTDPFAPGADFVRSLTATTTGTTTTQLGFPGAVDAMGGNPLLVVNGSVVAGEVDGSGPFFQRAGRTAVGATSSGKLLMVVVDGRQGGYSRGMTLRELAQLMLDLGAQNALNLDGGGSSAMAVNGLLASRPSDSTGERRVANALVVLPGADTGQADLTGGTATPGGLRTAEAPAGVGGSLRGAAERDPASVGGLADELVRSGLPVAPELRRAAESFRAAR